MDPFLIPHAGMGVLGLIGGLAATLGLFLRLHVWWVPIQAAIPALIYFAVSLDIPGWYFGGVFLLLLLVLWNSAGERVPLYLTGGSTKKALCDLLPKDEPVNVADLGSGLGGPLIAMARANPHPESRFVGYETAPLPYAISRLRILLAADPRLNIEFRSFWSVDMARFDFVYAFLSTAPMPRLLAKIAKEMRDGGYFVSNEFTDTEYPATQFVVPSGSERRVLHIWRAPLYREETRPGGGRDGKTSRIPEKCSSRNA